MMKMLSLAISTWIFLLSSSIPSSTFAQPFSDCSKDGYYQTLNGSVDQWTREDLGVVLRESHRHVLPYTSSSRSDVWDALIDLDVSNNDPDLVSLIYRNEEVTAQDYGEPDTWNREHLWPKSRGISTSGPDYTDIHALRPADWNVNAARSNLFFGDCSRTSSCTRQPATDEAASDTARGSDTWLPPVNVRGDIARALMYMDIRYSFPWLESTTSDLRLTDCPDDDLDEEMAYLSVLLEWHANDPVDDRERLRNDKACESWQGNRNPFVDHEELAMQFFASQRRTTCDGSSVVVSPTDAPETSNGGSTEVVPTSRQRISQCSDLSPGDVHIIAFNSDNPDSVTLVALEELPSGLVLFLTDSAWTGNGFASDSEGSLRLEIPGGGLSQGDVFGYGGQTGLDTSIRLQSFWDSTGSFALAADGDSVMCYCESNGSVRLLSAVISGSWSGDGASGLTSNESKVPSSLRNVGAVAIESGWDNFVYRGITGGTKGALTQALRNTANWEGNSALRADYWGGDFNVGAQFATNSGVHGKYAGVWLLSLSSLVVLCVM